MKERRPILRVEYLDHVEFSGESSIRDIEEMGPAKCWIIGEVLKEDDLSLTILSYNEEPQSDLKTEHYAMIILKSAILSRTELIPKGE